MTFFARPNLDNIQFEQLKDSTLTLSGQTQIATTSGLTLIGDGGIHIPIIATGATNNYVLTYDSTDQAIRLKESSASGGSTVYTYSGDTTCAVGGLPVGQNLFNDPLVDIIHCMVSPTLNPVLTNPSICSFVLSPTTLVYEVGCSVAIGQTTVFNAGCICPQYSSASSCRSNGTAYYQYGKKGVFSCVAPLTPSDSTSFGTVCITPGTNQLSSQIYYQCGVQPKDSSGADYSTPLVSGCTAASTKNICGIYPWYWGTGSTAPDVSTSGCTQCLIDSYTCKSCASSVGTITVDNFGVTGKYIWFATPYASTTKTCWQGANNVSNNGVIPGPLFPAPVSWCVDSCSGCWSGICYKVYVSNYATDINYGMTFCN